MIVGDQGRDNEAGRGFRGETGRSAGVQGRNQEACRGLKEGLRNWQGLGRWTWRLVRVFGRDWYTIRVSGEGLVRCQGFRGHNGRLVGFWKR